MGGWIKAGKELSGSIRGLTIAGLLLALTGCSGGGLSGLSMPDVSSLNPFSEKEVPLPGKRVSVMTKTDSVTDNIAAASAPVSLPPQRPNQSWTQPGGVPSNAPGHLLLAGTGKKVWSSSAGEGSSSDGKLTASPIALSGRIFTLDAEGNVTAFSASTGARAWRTSLTPGGEDADEGYGGGIAADNGRLYVATGFGTLVALDPQSGNVLWQKSLETPIRSSPTAAKGKVFVVTTEGRFYCLSGEDGTELWRYRGLSERASLLSNTSPAVAGNTVVVPFPSGDVVAVDISTGQAQWRESVARGRARSSSLASLNDSARPVIDSGVVYAVGHSGRMIATEQKTGKRLWSQSVGGTQQPWVAGQSVYVVDKGGRLMALSRKTGQVLWVAKLPGGKTWSGPVLAGGQLWLASSKGTLISVDGKTGVVAKSRDLGDPVYISPIVADGRMYVLTDNADLMALN